jgi:hypothetical protein
LSSRLEPSPRSPGIEEGLAARVHDPLWLLARQWQFGEFNGKDAGTPVVVHATGSASPINAWRGLNQPKWTVFDLVTDKDTGAFLGSAGPLDALIEQEDESEPSLRERVEAGAHFMRLLSAAGLGNLSSAFVSAHPFDLSLPDESDFATDPLFAAIAKRTPDGLQLHTTALALAAGQLQALPVAPDNLAALGDVFKDWLPWYTEEIHTASGTGTAVTWLENRLEYGFQASCQAAGQAVAGTVLVSDRYPGDGVDWFDFDIGPGADAFPGGPPVPPDSRPLALDVKPLAIDVKAVPHPVHFAGMPLQRFWAMEDAQCDFGSIDAAPNDIGRMLLVEFATVYSNDWFVLPLKLPAGTLTILDTVTVTDVFGRTFFLDRAGKDDPAWNMFSLDTRGGPHPAQNGLLLPPTSGPVMESSSVETVLFLRDEMADLAWGVETRVRDDLESSVDRRATWVAPNRPPPGMRDLPAYRVETVVPDYWIPLAPEATDQGSIRLRLVPMAADNGDKPKPRDTDPGADPKAAQPISKVEPKGRLLRSSDPKGLWLFEEEIPREGAQIDRLYRYARWHDGRTSMWTARRRRVGRGEGSSGLRFDVLDPG